MSFKLSFIFFHAFCLFASCLMFDLENAVYFYNRWTYANCFSEGEEPSEVIKICSQILTPEELKDHVRYLSNNETEDGTVLLQKYCNIDRCERRSAYGVLVKNAIREKDTKRADVSKQANYARLLILEDCVFSYLQRKWPCDDALQLPTV